MTGDGGVAGTSNGTNNTAAVQREVGALPGISSVQADAETKQIQVGFDPNQVSLDQIKVTLDEAGYPVEL